MTAKLQDQAHSPSRRAMLAGAVGGLGALAASAIGRAHPVRAEGQNVAVGGEYTDATSVTRIANLTNGEPVLWGESGSGTGVIGSSASNRGVVGASESDVGVYGRSTSHIGILAESVESGFALQTLGRTKFSTSGIATIASGETSKVITPGVNLTDDSFVLLSPRVNIYDRGLWFTIDGGDNRFTIRMSRARGRPTPVAWLLLG